MQKTVTGSTPMYSVVAIQETSGCLQINLKKKSVIWGSTER